MNGSSWSDGNGHGNGWGNSFDDDGGGGRAERLDE